MAMDFPETRLVGGSDMPTFAGINSFCRRPYARDLRGVDAAVLGIPFDAATSNRPGARFGPQAIRRASVLLDHDPHFPFGEDVFASLKTIDWGDCLFDFARHTEIPGVIRDTATEIIAGGAFLVGLGGDHFVTWPLLEAHAAAFGPLGLIQFDAHQDTWDDDGERIDHGTFVARAVGAGVVDPSRSIQIGIRTHATQDCGIEIVDADACADLGVAGIVDRIRRRVGAGPCYLTFDIDCLDPAFAPGTGTPVIGGLTTGEMRRILKALTDLDIVGGDVVEVAPAYDVADITAVAGATAAMMLLGLRLMRTRSKGR